MESTTLPKRIPANIMKIAAMDNLILYDCSVMFKLYLLAVNNSPKLERKIGNLLFMWQSLLEQARSGDFRATARCISLIENETTGYRELLRSLPHDVQHKIIGITGSPGSGKSTLVDSLIGEFLAENKRVAVVCIDPSSPFNLGALLGDRIRMSRWYTHDSVFIRSLASRGSLGGLHPGIIEITDLLIACPFDYIVVETVGVGQSEIEIAGLADVTVVVMVPEGGDEVQTMKAGLMEIADIFVVNKSDRPGADQLIKNLHLMLAPAFRQGAHEIPIIKTIATDREGVSELKEKIIQLLKKDREDEKKFHLLADRAWHLIQQKRMKDISKQQLKQKIKTALGNGDFSLYTFIENY
jgi:LAO/AO transport system kinase